ncbi:MAG: SDR family NAD(P)-dependent oxidoreductase [Verrucomicrobiota bacterium]
MRLRDKVLLVTGSTTGIGEAIARAAVAEGARVVLHGTRRAAGDALADELNAAAPGTAHFVQADLADPAAAPDLIEAAIAFGGGRLDALVNNAAIMTRGGLAETDADAFDRVVAVNLRAPLLLVRAAWPHFRERGGGRVLVIGSINAHCGESSQLAYSISKAGLVTMTRNLADAHAAEGLRINCLNVGWTLTENEYALKIREGLPENWPDNLSPHFAPSGRLLQPAEIGAAAMYFLSDDAALLNGGVLDFEQFPVVGRNPPK